MNKAPEGLVLPKPTPKIRNVATEKTSQAVGNTGAVSSKEALFYHLIYPGTIRRLALRKTVGGKKYGPIQAHAGAVDEAYVAERLNHLFEHLLKFLATGNTEDDNLGGMLWALDYLCLVNDKHPEVLAKVLGTSSLTGSKAKEFTQKWIEKYGCGIQPLVPKK